MKLPTLLLLLALPLRANGLDDLRATLGHLQGPGPIHGTYEVHTWVKGGSGKEVEESTGSASAWLEEDGSSLQIRWDKGLLKKMAEEEDQVKDKKAKVQDSTATGVGAASLTDMASAVDFAPKLARLLGYSQLKQERADTYQGKPAKCLDLQINPPRSEEDQKKMKEFSFTAQIWVGADGLPMAANFARTLKAKVLFFSIENVRQEDCVFTLAANRLLLASREVRETNHVMGVDTQQRTIATFTVR